MSKVCVCVYLFDVVKPEFRMLLCVWSWLYDDDSVLRIVVNKCLAKSQESVTAKKTKQKRISQVVKFKIRALFVSSSIFQKKFKFYS